jgi:hypothetical protein
VNAHAERYRDLLAAKWQETDLTLHLAPCLERLQTAGIHIADVVGDRGFASAKNSRALEAKKIGDHLCPRKVVDFKIGDVYLKIPNFTDQKILEIPDRGPVNKCVNIIFYFLILSSHLQFAF